MNDEIINLIPLIMVMITSTLLLISERWRWSIIALAVQYLAVFWLVSSVWPLGLSAVKLVAGWMAGAVLGASQAVTEGVQDEFRTFSGRVFRIFTALFVFILAFSIAPEASGWLPAGQAQLTNGVILIGMGILQMGMTDRPLRIILGLLTTLSGFEIIYASVANSVLVTGLLAVITLGLALAGSYLLIAPTSEEQI